MLTGYVNCFCSCLLCGVKWVCISHFMLLFIYLFNKISISAIRQILCNCEACCLRFFFVHTWNYVHISRHVDCALAWFPCHFCTLLLKWRLTTTISQFIYPLRFFLHFFFVFFFFSNFLFFFCGAFCFFLIFIVARNGLKWIKVFKQVI